MANRPDLGSPGSSSQHDDLSLRTSARGNLGPEASGRRVRFHQGGEPHAAETRGPAGPAGRDVICAGMYRACSTWQYEVVGHLVQRHFQGSRLGYVPGESYQPPAAAARHGARGAQSAWRVLKSHDGHRSFARALHSRRALAVYAFRDVREVAFSLMHKRGISFEQLLRQGMLHQVLRNDRFWRSKPGVLVQRYEEMIADPATAVVQLARHLGLGVTRREATEIANEFSLESNQARTASLRRRLEEAGLNLDAPENLQICDPQTLLHWNHLRSGQAGSWRTLATPDQRALLQRVVGPWLALHNYEPTALQAGPETETPGRVAGSARLRGEIHLAIGRFNLLLREVSIRFPAASRLVRRVVRPARGQSAGASPWKLPEASGAPAQHGGARHEARQSAPSDNPRPAR